MQNGSKLSVYKTYRWQKLRRYVIARDKGICQICHRLIKGAPEVDHIIELTDENYTDENIAFNPDNLRTLCKACHNKRHGREFTPYFHQYYFKKECIVDDDLNIDYERRVENGDLEKH